jgi:hypothetical protein
MTDHDQKHIEKVKKFIETHFKYLKIALVEQELNYKCKPDFWCIDSDLKYIFFEFKSPDYKGRPYHYGSKLTKSKAQAKEWFRKIKDLKLVFICGLVNDEMAIFYTLRKEDVEHITYKYS